MDFDTNDPPPGTCGIYAIYSACNDTIYVGHAGDILTRWKGHKAALRRGDKKRCNKHLLNAWRKYGPDAFEFYVIEECAIELLHIREQFHLDRYPRHYNFGECAESPRRGATHTEEAKAKMSVAATGRKASDESRAINSERMRGNTYARGVVHTSETRARVSEALTGRPVSEETRERLRVASTGRKHTPEAKEKMRGRKASNEAKAKMSAAAKARWARKREAKDTSEIRS